MKYRKILPLLFTITFAATAFGAIATPVHAYIDPTIQDLETVLPNTRNPKQTVINVIKAALLVLSLVAVVFIMYGGFRWLTAGGNEENVKKAKEVISAAVLGMIVVLLSYAVVTIVANITQNAVTTGNITG